MSKTEVERVDASTAAELEEICRLRDQAFEALHEANVRGVTGRDADAALAAFAAVDVRTADLQRRVWPKYRGTLVVALGTALLYSPGGRRARLVWERAR